MKSKIAIGLILASLLPGCASIGPKIARQAHYPYNEAIVASWKEQMLLNLVRLRYRDNPFFIQVSSITTSHTLGVNAGTDISFPNLATNNAHSFSPGIHYDEKPTITYDPLDGSTFAKKMLSTIDIENIIDFVNSGTSIERLMNVCVQQINGIENVPSAAGPTPEYAPEYKEFARVAENMRIMQKNSRLVMDSDPDYDATALYSLVKPGDKSQFMKFLPDPKYDHIRDELIHKLKVDPMADKYKITGNMLKPDDGINLKIQTRSFMGVMYYLSNAVCIPQRHLDCGLVTVTRNKDGSPFNWHDVSGRFLCIKCSKNKPKCATVSVCYKNHYFYIDDADLNSKTTFMLLLSLFEFQSAGGGSSLPPQLTLPVTG